MGGDRGIRLGEPAGVADFGGHQPVPSCGSDMLRDNVDQMHPVAPTRQRIAGEQVLTLRHQTILDEP
jgi:hypothetical protein